jgi:hypothetical protein
MIKQQSVNKARKHLLNFLFVLLIAGQLSAYANAPQKFELVPQGYEWKTISTEQGSIHYPEGYVAQTNYTLANESTIKEYYAPVRERTRKINLFAGAGLMLYFLVRAREKKKEGKKLFCLGRPNQQ